MKIDKPFENWTRYPNCILDNLDKFNGNELKVVSLMVRKNFGFENPNCKFSLSYIMVKCDIRSRSTANIVVQSLLKKGTIKVINKSPSGYEYDIIWRNQVVQKSNQYNNRTNAGTIIEPQVVQKSNSLKENKVKDNIKRKHTEGKPSFLTSLIKELFDKGHEKLNGKPIGWAGKHKFIYAKAIKDIIDLAGKDGLSEIAAKARILYKWCEEDDFYAKQGFLYTTLVTHWNRLQPKKINGKVPKFDVTHLTDEEWELVFPESGLRDEKNFQEIKQKRIKAGEIWQ